MIALAKFIMRGHIQAVLIVIASTLLSFIILPFGFISGASVGLVTLRKGELSGLVVIILSSLLFGLAIMASSDGNALLQSLLLLLLVLLMVWILAVVLRRLQSLPITIMLASLFGIIYIVGFYLSVSDVGNWWQIRLTQFLAPVLEQVSGQEQQAMYQYIDFYASQFTGLLAASVVFMGLLSLFIARWWQACLFNPQGFQTEFHKLKFSKYVAIFTLIIVAMNFVSAKGISHLSRDVLTVMLFSVYLLQGLAIGHSIIANKKLNVAWLVALYFITIFSYPLVAVLGFIDTWFDFRKRFSNTNPAT